MDRFVRISELLDRTGYSRGHIARLESAGKFPRRRRIGARTAAWLESEIEEWMRSRPMAAEVRPDSGGDLPARGHGVGVSNVAAEITVNEPRDATSASVAERSEILNGHV